MKNWEDVFRRVWELRNIMRQAIVIADDLDENGYITHDLDRLERDLTWDLKYLLSKIREERDSG